MLEPENDLWAIVDQGGKIALALVLIFAVYILIGQWIGAWPFGE